MSEPTSDKSETRGGSCAPAPCSANDDLATRLLCALSAETLYKADCFDYLCWLEETQQSDAVPGAKYLVMASDGTTCWGHSYADAVKVAMKHDKELYDAVKDLELPEPDSSPNAPHERTGAKTKTL